MQEVQSYKTNDGKLFENLNEAILHENYLKHKPEISEFMRSEFCEYKGGAHQTIIERTLANWILWQAKGGSK